MCVCVCVKEVEEEGVRECVTSVACVKSADAAVDGASVDRPPVDIRQVDVDR